MLEMCEYSIAKSSSRPTTPFSEEEPILLAGTHASSLVDHKPPIVQEIAIASTITGCRPLPNSSVPIGSIDLTAKILPLHYEECDIVDLCRLISDELTDLIEHQTILSDSDELTLFNSRLAPPISMQCYLLRFASAARIQPSVLLSVVYYIHRLRVSWPSFRVTTLTVHRFILAAVTIADKTLNDTCRKNSVYAAIGGVHAKELARLEIELLSKLTWRAVPDPTILQEHYWAMIGRSQWSRPEGIPIFEDPGFNCNH